MCVSLSSDKQNYERTVLRSLEDSFLTLSVHEFRVLEQHEFGHGIQTPAWNTHTTNINVDATAMHDTLPFAATLSAEECDYDTGNNGTILNNSNYAAMGLGRQLCVLLAKGVTRWHIWWSYPALELRQHRSQ